MHILKKFSGIIGIIVLGFTLLTPVVNAESNCTSEDVSQCGSLSIDCTPPFDEFKQKQCSQIALSLKSTPSIPQKKLVKYLDQHAYSGGGDSIFGSESNQALDTTSVSMNTYFPVTSRFSTPKSYLMYTAFDGKGDGYTTGESNTQQSYVFIKTNAAQKKTHDYFKCILMRTVSDGELLRANVNSSGSFTTTLNQPLAVIQNDKVKRGQFLQGTQGLYDAGKLVFDKEPNNRRFALMTFYQPGEKILPVKQGIINTTFESNGSKAPVQVDDYMYYFLGGQPIIWKDDNTFVSKSIVYSEENSTKVSTCIFDPREQVYKWDSTNTNIDFKAITPCTYRFTKDNSPPAPTLKPIPIPFIDPSLVPTQVPNNNPRGTWECVNCKPAFGTNKDLYGKDVDGVNTAIGCLPTSINGVVSATIRISLGVAGALAFIRIALALIRLITDGANPETVKNSHAAITSSIIGLLVIIFSVFILNLVGVQILNLNSGYGGDTINKVTDQTGGN